MPNQNKYQHLEKIDLLEGTFVEDRSRLVWLECIKHAVQTYLNFGLKRTSKVTSFYDAYYYLFQVRSTTPSTWGNLGKGRTESEVFDNCFDVHYDRSGLLFHCSMLRFLNKIQADRSELVNANLESILSFIKEARQKDMKNPIDVHTLPLPIPTIEQLMVEPKDPAKLAMLFYSPRKVSAHKSYHAMDANKFSEFWSKADNLIKSIESKHKRKPKQIPGQLGIGLENYVEGTEVIEALPEVY